MFDLCVVVWKAKYLIALITVLAGLAGVIFALTATPMYRAETVVTEVHEGNMSGAGALMSQLGGIASAAGVSLATGAGGSRDAQAVLKSRHLVEEFIKRNNLLPALSRGAKQAPTLWLGVQRFEQGVLTIKEDLRQGETTVAVEWTDPVTAARWANGFVALANDLVRTRTLNESTRNVTYLQEQISKTNIVELQRVMYNLIQSETKTLMLANARDEYAFTIIDPAVPSEQRARPKRALIVVFAILAGFLLGAIVAFARDRIHAGTLRP